MADRVKGLKIAFENEMRLDDAQCLIDAIYLIKNILKVEPLIIDDEHMEAVAEIRTKEVLFAKIRQIFSEKL